MPYGAAMKFPTRDTSQVAAFAVAAMLILAACSAGALSAGLQEAAADFRTYCAPCHGADGRGGGPAGAALRVAPPDLTAIAGRHGGIFPEDMIYEAVVGLGMPDAHGSREMPVWGDRFIGEAVGGSVSLDDARKAAAGVEARIHHLVDYLKSIQARD